MLLVLAVLLVVVIATSTITARRRMRRGAGFVAGVTGGGFATIGLAGLVVLVMTGDDAVRRAWRELPSWPWSAPAPLPDVHRPPPGPGSNIPAPLADVITGIVTHVRDGDTIVVAGTPIRLANLDCAERGTLLP